MAPVIDYFMVPNSPWTYFGHDRLAALATQYGAEIRIKPIDLGGQIFPASGGLPLGQRAPQRQAYRLVELKRFSEALAIPINIQPRFFPVPGDRACTLIVAVQLAHGDATAMAFAGDLLRAVWVDEENINDDELLQRKLHDRQLPDSLMAAAQSEATLARYQANTDEALAAGVFGSPTYVCAGTLYWGQDRLDFLARQLAKSL